MLRKILLTAVLLFGVAVSFGAASVYQASFDSAPDPICPLPRGCPK